MKSPINLLIMVSLVLCGGCNDAPAAFDSAVSIVIDKTDPMAVYPQPEDIVTFLGLKSTTKESAEVIITYVSDKDVNRVRVISIPAENRWIGNTEVRTARVHQFMRELKNALTTDADTSMGHSIIGRTIIKAANQLVHVNAKRKTLLIYSDLIENNADLNFYKPSVRKLLVSAPVSIQQSLEQPDRLTNLGGMQIWLLYAPPTYSTNSVYMECAHFYQHWLVEKGARVHIEQSLTPEP